MDKVEMLNRIFDLEDEISQLKKRHNNNKKETIYGNCPLCKEAGYHIIKKDVYIIDLEKDVYTYKCKNCKGKWGMIKEDE